MNIILKNRKRWCRSKRLGKVFHKAVSYMQKKRNVEIAFKNVCYGASAEVSEVQAVG